MVRLLPISLVALALVATPVLAGPTQSKRPICQVQKAPIRDAKRVEPCRRLTIPPVIDPTPMFLASTAGGRLTFPEIS